MASSNSSLRPPRAPVRSLPPTGRGGGTASSSSSGVRSRSESSGFQPRSFQEELIRSQSFGRGPRAWFRQARHLFLQLVALGLLFVLPIHYFGILLSQPEVSYALTCALTAALALFAVFQHNRTSNKQGSSSAASGGGSHDSRSSSGAPLEGSPADPSFMAPKTAGSGMWKVPLAVSCVLSLCLLSPHVLGISLSWFCLLSAFLGLVFSVLLALLSAYLGDPKSIWLAHTLFGLALIFPFTASFLWILTGYNYFLFAVTSSVSCSGVNILLNKSSHSLALLPYTDHPRALPGRRRNSSAASPAQARKRRTSSAAGAAARRRKRSSDSQPPRR